MTEEDSQGAKVGQMKTGDYMIHVYIVSGKNFKSDDCETINPVITVEVCGETKYTSAKQDEPTGSSKIVNWKEHLFFEPRNRHASQIEQDTICVKVMNKGMFRDEMIGMYEFDMTYIYYKDKSAMHNQWIALVNPESEDFSAVAGNLKLSIAVQGPGDEQVQLNDESGPEAANQETLMPAQIKKEFKQLKIRFIQADKLPKMDTFGTIDAFIETKFQGKTMKTEPVESRNDVAAIAQEWWLPIQWPLSSDRLVMKVLDYDKGSINNDVVGSMFFSLKDLVAKGERPNGYFFWQNLYGAPKDYSGPNVNLMNDNPEYASAWMGRCLMHIECQDSKHPERKQVTLEDSIKQAAMDAGFFTEKEYEIIVDLGLGICLPGDEKYTVKLKIGDFELNSGRPRESKKGYNRWSERFNTTTFKTVYQDLKAMDRLYVYLMKGDVPICYWKGTAQEFSDPNPKYRWLVMKNDQAIGKVTNDYEAGLIQMKISINDKKKNGTIDYKQFSAWKKPPPRRLNSRKVRCFIFQCKDIPAADEDGSSDAYISIWNQEGAEMKTKTIEDSLNPIYFETVELLYDMADLDQAPPIVLNIWDQDPGFIDQQDYLGRAVIYLHEAATNLQDSEQNETVRDNKVPKPKWEKIRMGFDESQPACGEILCSFVVARDDFEFQTPAKYMQLSEYVPTKDYNLEINILGLRNLESFGLMPIKKPVIKFRIRSLLPPEKAQAVTNVQTDPKANGPNPNINTMLTFNVQLPTEHLYCPSLACDAYDVVFKGFSQPLIGTFNLPIGDLKAKYEEERRIDIEECDRIIDYLEEQSGMSPDEILELAKVKSTQNSPVGKRFNGAIQNQLIESQDSMEDDSGEMRFDISEKKTANPKNSNYQQLESDEGHSENEETKFVDDVPSSQLSKSAKVQFEERLLLNIKRELADFMVQHQDAKKMTATDKALKSQLQRRLKETEMKLKEAKKKAEKELQELEKSRIIQSGNADDICNNILPPKYRQDDEQGYEEIDIPSKTMYKKVGYNDLPKIKEMLEGNDAEKRSGVLRKATTMHKKTASKDEEAQRKLEEVERMLDLTNLHYRRFYDDELENNKDLFPKAPFINVDIKRGQSRGLKKSWFSFGNDKTDESGQISNEKIVGQFKGRIRVYNDAEEKEYKALKREKMQQIMDLIKSIHQKIFNQPFEISLAEIFEQGAEELQKFNNKLKTMAIDDPALIEFFKDEASEERITRQLLTQTQAAIQLYVLECFDLASRDIGSASDPYMVIRYGETVKSDRDLYQLDEANPKINRVYEFSGSFPGAFPLSIEAWDYDDLFGDDLIGKTLIDLDDRFFSPDWQALEEKPIEYRQIYHESTSLSQGVIQCWLEIEPQAQGQKNKKEQKLWDITSEPERPYQIRLSIMDTKNIPCMDIEGTSDVFIKAYLDDNDKRTTDTHYRCKSGDASFNYRLIYDIEAGPKRDEKDAYLLVLQAWDFDILKNDYICEWTFDLKPIFAKIRQNQQGIKVNEDFMTKNDFESKMNNNGTTFKFRDDDTFHMITQREGKEISVRVDLRILPGSEAKATEVGSARTEPNMEPYLPPPVGRIQFSLNPFTMLSQLCGKEFAAKIITLVLVIACIALCVAMAPMIFSNVVGQILMAPFKN